MQWTVKTRYADVTFTSKPDSLRILQALRRAVPNVEFYWVELISEKGTSLSIDLRGNDAAIKYITAKQ